MIKIMNEKANKNVSEMIHFNISMKDSDVGELLKNIEEDVIENLKDFV